MTFDEIVSDICDRLNLTDADAITRVGKHVNRRYRRVKTSIGVRDEVSRVTSAYVPSVGTRLQTITSVEKVIAVFTELSPTDPLDQLTYEEMQERTPGTGNPTCWSVKRSGASSVTLYFDSDFTDADDLIIIADETNTTLSGTTEPAFPESFHDILVFGATADELRKKDKLQMARDAEGDYERLLAQLRLHIAVSGYKDVQVGKNNLGSPSQFGSGSGASGGSSASGGQVAWDLGGSMNEFESVVAADTYTDVPDSWQLEIDADFTDDKQVFLEINAKADVATAVTITVRLFNVTTGAAVSGSEAVVTSPGTTRTRAISANITTLAAGRNVYKAQLKRSSALVAVCARARVFTR